MFDWEKMASVVARRLVEDGQTRILQRIYEGVTSNWDLDVADDKSSKDHSLIHLVWRKFPRNRHPSEERRSTAVSTQTEEGSSAMLGSEEGSSAMLGLGTTAGLTRLPLKFGPRKILDQQSIEIYSGSDLGKFFATESASSKNSIISDMDCLSASNMTGLFDGNESASNSDAGWTSDCSISSSDLVTQEGASFKFPAKGHASKPKIYEPKSQVKLFNRFKCLEDSKVRKSSSIYKSRKRKDVPPLTSEIPTTSTHEDISSNLRRRGIVKWYDPTKMSYGFITMNSKDVFFHVKSVRGGVDHLLKPGDEVSFIIDEYDKGAIDVQFLPTLSDCQSSSDIPIYEMESRPGDESWETVDSNSENEEVDELAPCPYSRMSDKLVSLEYRLEQIQLALDQNPP